MSQEEILKTIKDEFEKLRKEKLRLMEENEELKKQIKRLENPSRYERMLNY